MKETYDYLIPQTSFYWYALLIFFMYFPLLFDSPPLQTCNTNSSLFWRVFSLNLDILLIHNIMNQKWRTQIDLLEEYLITIKNENHRNKMRQVLFGVKNSFPILTPKIAWNQPMFTDHGTFIIGFSAAKHHFSISPEPKGIHKFSDEILSSGYQHKTNLFRIKSNAPSIFLY